MRDRPDRPARPKGRSRPGGAAPAARPSPRRAGATRSGAATRTSAPRPPGRLTGRAVVLAVVLLALAMSYVFPLRIYLTQQAEIAELRTAQAAQRAHIEALEAEATRWTDQEYIRIQARKRLKFVEPGEIPVITVWEEDAATDRERDPQDVPVRPEAWWQTLWSSVRAADEEPAGGGTAG